MRRLIAFALVVIVSVGTLSACVDDEKTDKSRKEAVSTREEIFDRAESIAPAPIPENFPVRKALVKYTERQDLINHPWYIYIMGMNGNYVGYFVGQTYPVNACNFLSSTERELDTGNTEHIVTAPSYDGIFYGGGGSSAACGTHFFFDVETDAMHTFNAPMWFASDVPLDLEVPRLNTVSE